jgi:hypothetical protein
VFSLKKHLRVVEGFTDECPVQLFDSCAAQSPMDDKSTILLLTGGGPGSLPHKPLALVFRDGKSRQRPNAHDQLRLLVAPPELGCGEQSELISFKRCTHDLFQSIIAFTLLMAFSSPNLLMKPAIHR